jgi:hypothetical protein
MIIAWNRWQAWMVQLKGDRVDTTGSRASSPKIIQYLSQGYSIDIPTLISLEYLWNIYGSSMEYLWFILVLSGVLLRGQMVVG